MKTFFVNKNECVRRRSLTRNVVDQSSFCWFQWIWPGVGSLQLSSFAASSGKSFTGWTLSNSAVWTDLSSVYSTVYQATDLNLDSVLQRRAQAEPISWGIDEIDIGMIYATQGASVAYLLRDAGRKRSLSSAGSVMLFARSRNAGRERSLPPAGTAI